MDGLSDLLRDQVAYYRACADEFDRLYETREDLRSLDALSFGLPIVGDVLELACGTGRWTSFLAGLGHRVTAVDVAPEMLDVARRRVAAAGRSSDVEFVEADLFGWLPPRRYDTVFFACWLSHVPPARFDSFWNMVGTALLPGGRACFIDTGPGERPGEELLDDQPAPAVRRRLEDGTVHRIVKLFPDPERLVDDLRERGWSARTWSPSAKLLAGFAWPQRPVLG